MSAIPRFCARPCCSEPAFATLSYDYSTRTVWLDQLSDAPHPMTHDMCERHTERLSVPLGWQLQNRLENIPLALRHALMAS